MYLLNAVLHSSREQYHLIRSKQPSTLWLAEDAGTDPLDARDEPNDLEADVDLDSWESVDMLMITDCRTGAKERITQTRHACRLLTGNGRVTRTIGIAWAADSPTCRQSQTNK
jgi:hypothetical protein